MLNLIINESTSNISFSDLEPMLMIAFSKSTLDTLLNSQIDYKKYLLNSIKEMNVEIQKLQLDAVIDPNLFHSLSIWMMSDTKI